MTSDGPRPGTELLAVDLGLRTGLAQYGADGRLRAYRSKHFGSVRELRRGVHAILREDPVPGWVWVEGGGELAEVWERQAQHDGIEFRQVHATDWRTRLPPPGASVQSAAEMQEQAAARIAAGRRLALALYTAWIARLPGTGNGP